MPLHKGGSKSYFLNKIGDYSEKKGDSNLKKCIKRRQEVLFHKNRK